MMTTTEDALVVGPAVTPKPAPTGGSNKDGQVNFVGTKNSVMQLFTLPYSDKSVSVGIHNVEGCLLIDGEPIFQETAYKNEVDTVERGERSRVRRRSHEEVGQFRNSAEIETSALAVKQALIEKGGDRVAEAVELIEKSPSNSGELLEYVPWQFPQGINWLVGSNALVYRSTSDDAALTLRVEDAERLRQQLKLHQNAEKKKQQILNEQQKPLRGKLSYAEAVLSRQIIVRADSNNNKGIGMPSPGAMPQKVGASADISTFTLQTTMIPSPNLSLGEKFSVTTEPPPASESLPSPVCTVIDAYLDQLIANVPQLALVLREKGFVQSVKLLNTEHIPTCYLEERTFDTSRPFEVILPLGKAAAINSPTSSEQIFDPNILQMNAASLLNFLRANCLKDNATYLLHREAGQTNIQLLDVTAISSKRQRKWIWWLAMMSSRFANRLRQLSMNMGPPLNTNDAVLRRTFRARERSLLQNTLSLLEDFTDMGGQPHEILVAEVCERLADTFLRANTDDAAAADATTPQKPIPATGFASNPQERFDAIKPDALNKAQDYLTQGISVLWKVWVDVVGEIETWRKAKAGANQSIRSEFSTDKGDSIDKLVFSIINDGSSSSDDDDDDADMREIQGLTVKAQTLVVRLHTLHNKSIDIFFRLAEHNLNGYVSSSAMQTLRGAARKMADSVQLTKALGGSSMKERRELKRWKHLLQTQFARLWELCGHFARSFAADELFRELGHCCGDDVVAVLRDVEYAIPLQPNHPHPYTDEEAHTAKAIFSQFSEGVQERAGNLYNLSGIVCSAAARESNATEAAKLLLERKRQLDRDKRRVLVAACLAYSRASAACQASIEFLMHSDLNRGSETKTGAEDDDLVLLNILRQRQGDANNEVGKLMLTELRALLAAGTSFSPESEDEKEKTKESKLAAEPLLTSAEHWFTEGLKAFESCSDVKNAALLRCNLCQCYKLRANANFANSHTGLRKGKPSNSDKSSHADTCLKEAIAHLQAAHETIGQRDSDPGTWDMVSNELAATLLVLGVRRRQALLGGGSTPALLHLIRLSPGETRSITEPMEKALLIYEEAGNAHQAAATHYQLAQFFSKIWTCQRDEVKTREKLSAAFKHFNAAHSFFAASVQGNEATCVLLCLDLSNLYSSVSGEDCLCQALLRCVDTIPAFSKDAVDRYRRSGSLDEWIQTMSTLAASVEDRLFKTLKSLVKLEEEKNKVVGRYKHIYRSALTAKIGMQQSLTEGNSKEEATVLALQGVLLAAREAYSSSSQKV